MSWYVWFTEGSMAIWRYFSIFSAQADASATSSRHRREGGKTVLRLPEASVPIASGDVHLNRGKMIIVRELIEMDVYSKAKRAEIMAKVGGKNTKPELYVRSALHKAGYRFRLHRKDLSGRPDLILPKYRLAVFVHGCFWHGHDCKRAKLPTDNREFWAGKIQRNMSRDRESIKTLQTQGWTVRIIWQCELRPAVERLIDELSERGRSGREIPAT